EVERVLPAWVEWAAAAPDEVTTSFRLLNLPPLPEIPEPVRGRHIVMVDGAVLGDDDFAASVVADLRALRPEIDTFGRVPVPALARLHLDPEQPSPGVSSSTMLAGMPQPAVDAFLAQVGPGRQGWLAVVVPSRWRKRDMTWSVRGRGAVRNTSRLVGGACPPL